MDEPFPVLDSLIRTRLQDELLELQRKLQCTIIFVSHDLDEAFKLGNRVAIMDVGALNGNARFAFAQATGLIDGGHHLKA